MASSLKESAIKPRIIIHGGAGNITRENLPPASYHAYRTALLGILDESNHRLSLPGAEALDIATFAVEQLENNGLFNSGHGAVYTREGTHELEASVMVSRGYRKRGVGVMRLTRVRNPIKLAREMLQRGEENDGGGAQQHCQLAGESCDRLAREWGLDMVEPSYFWTRRRWDEHRRGLGKEHDDETYQKHKRDADCDSKDSVDAMEVGDVVGDPSWNGRDYLPQGTVGCVVMDSTGTLCVATSTGGLTNKVPGRIGDTPTLGAGFWAEEWDSTHALPATSTAQSPLSTLSNMIVDCLPSLSGYLPVPTASTEDSMLKCKSRRGAAMSGTGNGDSFLRVSAVRTAAAMARFSPPSPHPSSSFSSSHFPLQQAVTAVAGPHGVLQQSAEDRWLKTGEGEGGIIGIEFTNGQGKVVADFNCGGMFRSWIDDKGKAQMRVLREEYRE